MFPGYDKGIYIDSDIIVPGDISKMYNITVEDLMNKNNLGNPNVLYPGQILNV